MSWLQLHKQGCVVTLKVSPGARGTSLGPALGPWMKMRVHAPAEKGAANEQIIRWFCQALELRRDQVELLSGHLQSLKRLLLRGVAPTQLQSLLPQEDFHA